MRKSNTQILDYLADKALRAIEAQKPQLGSWLADKRRELLGKSRLDVLRFITFDLDRTNRTIVFESMGLDASDTQALERILRKI